MSTRANIVIQERYFVDNKLHINKMFFYRHSDGYPEGTLPSLTVFMKWLKDGNLRTNTQQAAGWLILLGALEYNAIPNYKTEQEKGYGGKTYTSVNLESIKTPTDWKCGAYEPTTCIHGDIEFLYVIDLTLKELKCYDSWTDNGDGKHEVKLIAKKTA